MFGTRAVARGTLVPAEAGVRVVLERRDGGAWRFMRSSRTDWAGRFVDRRPPRAERRLARPRRRRPLDACTARRRAAALGPGPEPGRRSSARRSSSGDADDGRPLASSSPSSVTGARSRRSRLRGCAADRPDAGRRRVHRSASSSMERDVRPVARDRAHALVRLDRPGRRSRSAPGSRSCTSTYRRRRRASARSSSTRSSPSRRRVGSTGPAPSTPRPGVRSRRTSSRRRATAARGRTSRCRRAGRS